MEQWKVLQPLLGLSLEWLPLVERIEAEREVVGVQKNAMSGWDMDGGTKFVDRNITAPATDAARQWAGWGTSLKPSFEPVIWATKPLHNVGDCAIIIQNLTQMEAELCKRIASVAAKSSQPIQHGLSEARGDSVQTPAPIQAGVAVGNETGTGAAGVTSWAAAISGSTPEAAHIALNTISLWRRTLEDALSLANTCTTETASSLITDLKTWSLSLSQITLDNIIQAAFHPSGLIAPVSNAAQYFSVVSAKSNAIRELIAQGLVTGSSEIRPAWEPIIVARKPLCGTVAENVLRYGTGAINVDACRVNYGDGGRPSDNRWGGFPAGGYTQPKGHEDAEWLKLHPGGHREFCEHSIGRFPANLIHDGSDEVVRLFPQTQNGGAHNREYNSASMFGMRVMGPETGGTHFAGDSGSAARFFKCCLMDDPDAEVKRLVYCAKASKADRDEGCEGRDECKTKHGARPCDWETADWKARGGNHHPTVKPTALMRYLCRLVTPPGGVVLDPFMGSGSTGKGALLEGFRFIGIEREPEYVEIARARLAAVQPGLL